MNTGGDFYVTSTTSRQIIIKWDNHDVAQPCHVSSVYQSGDWSQWSRSKKAYLPRQSSSGSERCRDGSTPTSVYYQFWQFTGSYTALPVIARMLP